MNDALPGCDKLLIMLDSFSSQVLVLYEGGVCFVFVVILRKDELGGRMLLHAASCGG